MDIIGVAPKGGGAHARELILFLTYNWGRDALLVMSADPEPSHRGMDATISVPVTGSWN